MHSALRINSSALAPQQINMASGCALQGAGDVASGKVLILHYEGPSLDYQQHNQNKEASKQANKQTTKTSELGTGEMSQWVKAGAANSSRWKERTKSLYVDVSWLVTVVVII